MQILNLSDPDIWNVLLSILQASKDGSFDDEFAVCREDAEIEREIRMLDNYVPTNICCDIFISYRRHLGRDLARNVQLKLQLLGYTNVFFDYESIRDGVFNTQIIDAIYSCKDFLLLLSPESMERCSNRGDWVAREIRTALKYNRKIIPLVLENDFQWPKDFPSDLRVIKDIQFHKMLFDEYFDDSVRKLSQRLSTRTALAAGGDQGPGFTGIQTFNYKVLSETKCLIYIDDNPPVTVEAGKLVKIPLPKGEYFVKATDYATGAQIFKKIIAIDSDKAEMI